jgi:hypothetical protein
MRTFQQATLLWIQLHQLMVQEMDILEELVQYLVVAVIGLEIPVWDLLAVVVQVAGIML